MGVLCRTFNGSGAVYNIIRKRKENCYEKSNEPGAGCRIVLTVVYLFVEYYLPLLVNRYGRKEYGERRLRAEKGGGMLIAERSITMRESLL